MAKIKQLASFAVLNVNGGDRVTYTYDEIDAETGDLISANNKGNFFVVDPTLKGKITQIRNYIQENKLTED
ncbi:MAG: hypothetical protein IKE74_04215 [Mogibacterium sp.]|nr:hypothetical protein [Mogibacterium sp.]